MAGLLGDKYGRASTIVVGLAACVCGAVVSGAIGACAQQPAEAPLPEATAEPAVHATAEGPAAAPSATSELAASVSASASPLASVATSSTAAPSASGSAAPPVGSPVQIEIGDPKFTSGDVPNAKVALDKLAKKFKTCIDGNGGLTGPRGELELSFLVRASGVAEGADVGKAKGIGDAAKKCVRDALKKKSIGTPSDDPIGVTVVLKLTAAP